MSRGRLKWRLPPVERSEVLPPVPNENSSRRSRLLWQVAQFSQIGMLVLVFIGYYFTVRPVFQKEKLEEDIARLQLEYGEAQEIYADMQSEYEKYKNELESSKSEAISLRKQNDKYSQEIITQKNLLAESQYQSWRRQRIDGSSVMMSLPLIEASVNLYATSPKDISESLKKAYLSPIDLAKRELQSLKQSEEVFAKRLSVEFEAGIEANIASLTCPAIDENAWSDARRLAMDRGKLRAESCYNDWLSKFISSNKFSKRQAKYVTESKEFSETRERNRLACLINNTHGITKRFAEYWHKFFDPCSTRIILLYSIVLGEPLPESLPPFHDPAPPSLETLDPEGSEASPVAPDDLKGAGSDGEA